MSERHEGQQDKHRHMHTQHPSDDSRSEIRLMDFVHALRKHLLLICICAAVGLVFGVVLSVISYMRGEMSHQYEVNTSMAITSQNENGMFTSQYNNPNSTDIHLAEDMVDSVIYVLKSDITLNKVIDRMNLIGVTNRDIYSNLSIVQYKETQIIEIKLLWRSAQEGVEILNNLNEVAKHVLIDTLKIGNVSVINEPTSKYLIGGQINARLWLYMFILGCGLGCGIAILQMLIAPTIVNSMDMEQIFDLEVMSEIPEKKNYFRKKRNLLVASDDPEQTEVIDNYSSLAYVIKHRLSDQRHKCIYVTSATQSEGKTTVTAHLGTELAEIGLKVLLVDFDTRNPKLGGIFLNKVEYKHSMNALYRGDSSKEEAITNLTGKLDLLPAVLERKTLPLDEELFHMIKGLQADYDIIMLDTAPVGLVADTMGLNQLADYALFVVRFDAASIDHIRNSITRLKKSGVEIMGCVVNGVKNFKITPGDNRYYHYGRYGKTNRYGKTVRHDSLADTKEEHIPEDMMGEEDDR